MSDVTLKRIMDLETQSEVDNSVYTIIDSPTGYGKKFPLGGLVEEVSDLKQDYNQLSETTADKNSDNPNMGSGYASQLVSSLRKSDSVPYNFRKVPYDATLEDGSIVGASVAWNQMVDPPASGSSTSAGITYTYDGNGRTTCSGTLTDAWSYGAVTISSFSFVKGHIYMLTGCPTGGSESWLRLWVNSITAFPAGHRLFDDGRGKILDALANESSIDANVMVGSAYTGDISKLVFVPQLTDLTQMLGTTIADYVYSLETATAGSGVAWLKEHFPKQFGGGYQAYNTGEIKSISGLAEHKSVGFNAWDEVWEDGLISGTTGQNVSGNGIRSKNMNRCIPNTSYYYKAPGNAKYVMWYDADENFISPGYRESDGVLTSPSNATYFRLRVDGITTYSNDICINLSKPTGTPKNGDYVAYEEHSYALDSTKTLRGILKLDSNNKLYADGDVWSSDGKVTRKYGSVDLGSLGWTKHATYDFFNASLSTLKAVNGSEVPNMVVKDFMVVSYNDRVNYTVPIIDVRTSDNWIEVRNTSYTDAATFKTAMNGVYLVYELATPTTESASPYGNPQVINPDGTESYVYTDGAFELPVGHDSEYPVNVSGQLDDILDTPTTNGTYTLQATVTDGVVAYEWVSA